MWKTEWIPFKSWTAFKNCHLRFYIPNIMIMSITTHSISLWKIEWLWKLSNAFRVDSISECIFFYFVHSINWFSNNITFSGRHIHSSNLPFSVIHITRIWKTAHTHSALMIFIWFIYDANSTHTLTSSLSVCVTCVSQCLYMCSNFILPFFIFIFVYILCRRVVVPRKWSCYFYQRKNVQMNDIFLRFTSGKFRCVCVF